MPTILCDIVRPSIPVVPHNPLRLRNDHPVVLREDRIERARQRIASGYYDRQEALLDLLMVRMAFGPR